MIPVSLDTIVTLASLLGVAISLFGAIHAALRNLRNDLKRDIDELRAEVRSVDKGSARRDAELGVRSDELGAELRGGIRQLGIELRGEIQGLDGRLGEEIRGLDGRLRGEIRGLDDRLRGEIRELDGRLSSEIRELRGELAGGISRVDDRVMFLMTRLIPEPAASSWAPSSAASQ